jgi:hypothetical protein
MLLSALLGTYLDLYFVGKGLYAFPIRPMSTVFSINIAFTLIGLPLLMGVFLYFCHKMNAWQKAGLMIIVSLLMSVMEKQAEALGFFVHHESWTHMYSFVGYTLYLTCLYFFNSWLKRTYSSLR